MNKEYNTPEFEIIKLHLSADVLNISDGENTGSGGGGTGGQFDPSESDDVLDF